MRAKQTLEIENNATLSTAEIINEYEKDQQADSEYREFALTKVEVTELISRATEKLNDINNDAVLEKIKASITRM